MSMHIWLLYLATATGLSLAPGPNSLLALSHGALYGRSRTFFTIGGGALGFLLIIALSLFGVAAILQASVTWLTVLKWAGGAYLVWLGIQVWRSPVMTVSDRPRSHQASALALFRHGFLAAATNPKGILFFAAFLPQFVDPARNMFIQFVILAATFLIIEFIVELLLASLAQRITHWLARVGRAFNRTCGALFMLLGVLLPLES